MEVARANPARSREHQMSHRPVNVLEVRDLSVRFYLDSDHEFTVLDKISFDIAPGEILGLLGESGSGKTTLALSLLRLLSPAARVAGGSIRFRGHDLLALNERQLRQVRHIVGAGRRLQDRSRDSELLLGCLQADVGQMVEAVVVEPPDVGHEPDLETRPARRRRRRTR